MALQCKIYPVECMGRQHCGSLTAECCPLAECTSQRQTNVRLGVAQPNQSVLCCLPVPSQRNRESMMSAAPPPAAAVAVARTVAVAWTLQG